MSEPGIAPHPTPAADQSHTDAAAAQTPSGGDVLIARRHGRGPHGCSPCPVRHARDRAAPKLPCQQHDPEMWFAETPTDLERAKGLCAACPARLTCLAVAVDGQEYAGVWGGQIFDRGQIVPHKRPRGRPRKHRLPSHPRPLSQDETVRTSQCFAPHNPPQNRVDGAARRLHDAESALSAAHQSHVDAQITSANRKLRDAATEYSQLSRRFQQLRTSAKLTSGRTSAKLAAPPSGHSSPPAAHTRLIAAAEARQAGAISPSSRPAKGRR